MSSRRESPGIFREQDWSEPEPLGQELPPVSPFDAGLLPVSLRPMVEDISDRMQTPPDFAAVVSVMTLRRALRTARSYATQSTRSLMDSNAESLGRDSCRSRNDEVSPGRQCDRTSACSGGRLAHEEYAGAQREYEAAQERARLDNSVWAESYKRASRRQEPLPAKPELEIIESSQRRLIAADATFESLHQLLAENPAGVFVLRDELSGWLASLERQGRESERCVLPGVLEWRYKALPLTDRAPVEPVEPSCVSLFGGIPTGPASRLSCRCASGWSEQRWIDSALSIARVAGHKAGMGILGPRAKRWRDARRQRRPTGASQGWSADKPLRFEIRS